jgi:hypothetical protein
LSSISNFQPVSGPTDSGRTLAQPQHLVPEVESERPQERSRRRPRWLLAKRSSEHRRRRQEQVVPRIRHPRGTCPGMPFPGHERADEGQQPRGSRHRQETDSQDVFWRLVTIGCSGRPETRRAPGLVVCGGCERRGARLGCADGDRQATSRARRAARRPASTRWAGRQRRAGRCCVPRAVA